MSPQSGDPGHEEKHSKNKRSVSHSSATCLFYCWGFHKNIKVRNLWSAATTYGVGGTDSCQCVLAPCLVWVLLSDDSVQEKLWTWLQTWDGYSSLNFHWWQNQLDCRKLRVSGTRAVDLSDLIANDFEGQLIVLRCKQRSVLQRSIISCLCAADFAWTFVPCEFR